MCYIVPTTAAIITTLINKKKTQKLWWLNLMFYGAAIFGIVDHLWNGELFLVSSDWIKDLMLGVLITLVTLVVWLFLSLSFKVQKQSSTEQNQI